MTSKECIQLIKMDLARFDHNGESRINILTDSSLMITFWLRICSWLFYKENIFAKVALVPVKVIYKFTELLTGIQVPLWTQIGGGICFKHYSCIIIAGSVVIGENCTIHQGVTLGRTFAGKKSGVPYLEDHVVVFPGAKVIGNVHIGRHAVIGANAVVLDDVPANCVVAGVPAKVISSDSSKCFDEYWAKTFDFTN